MRQRVKMTADAFAHSVSRPESRPERRSATACGDRSISEGENAGRSTDRSKREKGKRKHDGAHLRAVPYLRTPLSLCLADYLPVYLSIYVCSICVDVVVLFSLPFSVLFSAGGKAWVFFLAFSAEQNVRRSTVHALRSAELAVQTARA